MRRYGRLNSTTRATGTTQNIGRANVHGTMPENGWAYRYEILCGRTSSSATYVRGHLLAVSSSVPGALLAATSELTVSNTMSYGGDGSIIGGNLSAIVPLTAGTRYALGYASRGGQI